MVVGLALLLRWQKDWKLSLADLSMLTPDYTTICSGGLVGFSINTHCTCLTNNLILFFPHVWLKVSGYNVVNKQHFVVKMLKFF